MKILIIIPAYNEEENILKVAKDIKKNAAECDYLVVNDCSKDRTGEILDENNIEHVDLCVNLGIVGAVQTGYVYAYENGYDCAIQFDGDGQHRAEYISLLAKEIENGADIAIGSRFVEKEKDWSPRMIGSRIISALIKLKTGVTIKDPTSGFRLLNRKMLKHYAYEMNAKCEPDTLTRRIKEGAVVKEIQVEMNEREAGQSVYSNIWASFMYMMKMIISIIFIS